jgi:hypothetical protein
VAYPIVNDGLERVLELLAHLVALQNVDNAQEEQKPLALVISRGDSAGTENARMSSADSAQLTGEQFDSRKMFLLVDGVGLGLDGLHGRRVRHQLLLVGRRAVTAVARGLARTIFTRSLLQ